MQEEYSIPISVIIPVYNSENYLFKCLDSVSKQTIDNFEVIIIDDGSTDSSAEIINNFIKKNSNFISINQNNMGAAIARNNGIKRAKGEFIAFVDSDDFIDENYLKDMYEVAKKEDCDVVCCAFSKYFPKTGKISSNMFMIPTGIYSTQQMINYIIQDVRVHYYMWDKLWKRKIFEENNITYPQMCFEDITTVPKLIYYANRVAVINKTYYYYTKNENSLVHSVSISQLNDYIKSLAMLRMFLEEKKIYDNFKWSYRFYSYRTLICNFKLIFLICKQNGSFKEFFNILIRANKQVLRCANKTFSICNEEDIKDFPGLI